MLVSEILESAESVLEQLLRGLEVLVLRLDIAEQED
jgi:hypothetical protein